MKGETKVDRFQRVAQKRVQRVLDSLKSLSQCSNKRMYQWNNAQAHKIWNAIDKAYKDCRTNFEKAEPEEFKF